MAYEQLLMSKNLSGVGTFAHEMTHGNDRENARAVLGAPKRAGLGAEILTRSMFETGDVTVGNSARIKPIFLFNTTTPIPESDRRIQASESLNTKEKLETYSRHLIDLIAYLEAKEAEIALNLSEADKLNYFIQVKQVETDATAASRRTTDQFVAAQTAPNTIEDLVKNGYVSGQFVAHGMERFTTIVPNQYDFIPLFESFYAANVAEAGKNMVGDISVKRNAHEIIGWLGYDQMATYLSDRYSNDIEAFNAIGAGNYQDYKVSKYRELLQKEAVNQLWTDEELTRELTAAIQADLAILRNGNSSQIYSQATHVRAVKQKILNKALQYNDLKNSVLQDKATAYVADAILPFNTQDRTNPQSIKVGNVETISTPLQPAIRYVGDAEKALGEERIEQGTLGSNTTSSL
ncbi:ZmpA/ZmpB/ZmpC family metallo-endopeptidase [Streptococcus acidominimus]|uniref:ZmpA/ZmpB/ZmpC family metallo-endopeptidase n=1 Tax=Streptococcus acidominimus TaxID=1326 RepID=UPI000946ADAC|nr:ZmpA/ZmpB/ZmpC family metallo-endopeptidase [Streptococcus acidominimus]